MRTKIGYFAITDAWTPAECLQQAVAAEKTGFDSLWVEDHLIAMPGGIECNFAWTVMSSALQATKRVPFITGVTAPIMRYHPAIVAQAFATMGAMYPGRAGIGVGTGEPPNEMAVYGGEWPSNNTRLEMLEEALTVMNRLWTSDTPVSSVGKYYTLKDAVLLTKPSEKVPVYVSAIGSRAADLAGRLGDHLITLANNPRYVREELLPAFEAGARSAGRDPGTMERVGHFTYIYDPDHVVRPEQLQQDAGTIQGGAMAKAFVSGVISIFHSAEDFIKKIEEMKGMGYNHLAIANNSILVEKGSRVPSEEAPGLKIWKEVLPHVR
ncbi:MAG TPA: LLM class flavin-dependent oxidoreductase [Methanoregulaceae archaeon]|nr:LLM class flavin-dependent oxidoreductase [Methanoregulaceae archaeon]